MSYNKLIRSTALNPDFKSGLEAPLSINPEHTPSLSPGSRMGFIMKKMRDALRPRTGLYLLAAGLMLCFFPSCGSGKTGPGDASATPAERQKMNRVVLQVAGVNFTNEDFDRYVRAMVGEKSSAFSPPALSRLFDDFVEEKIFFKRAQNQGITLTGDEKAGYMSRLESAMGGTKTTRTPAEETALAERLLVEKYLYLLVKDLKVEDKDVSAYYSQNKGDYLQPEKAQVSQILLTTEGRASQIRDRLNNATEDQFRSIARTESSGPESVKGGVMGVFSAGQLPPELEKFIFPMKEGEISRVVESSYGYHIFRLDKRIEGRLVTQAEAAPSIRSKLLDQKSKQAIAAHLVVIKSALDWKATTENLTFAYQRNET